MKRYIVKKSNETIEVLIMKHKNSELYSFVNLTKGHICPCKFNSIEEAIHDMDIKISQGKILEYIEI